MKRLNLELGVGVFVLAGLLCLTYLSVRLGDLGVFKDDTYELTGRFVSVSGLKEGAFVEIAGVTGRQGHANRPRAGRLPRKNQHDHLLEISGAGRRHRLPSAPRASSGISLSRSLPVAASCWRTAWSCMKRNRPSVSKS